MYGLKNVLNRHDDSLTRVAWDRLEVLLGDHYRAEGWEVEHIGTGRTGSRFDGGIDLKLRRHDEYVVVQCKHWNAKQVPHNAVHELLGIMVNEGASGAVLATSGEFTRYARESAARGGRVQLIDGDALRAMLGPIPELEGAPGTASSKTILAARLGERLLSAAEDRIRGGGGLRHPRRRVAQLTFTGVLLKIGLFLLFAWFIFVVIGGALQRVIKNIDTPRQPATQTATYPTSATSHVPVPARSISSTNSTSPCHEIIDAQSGTYINDCMETTPYKPPTPAQIRESQRKADEAAAILAPSTPEM